MSMMDIEHRRNAFSRLGELMVKTGTDKNFVAIEKSGLDAEAFELAVERAINANAWFTREMVFKMLQAIGTSLNQDELLRWVEQYDFNTGKSQKNVAVIMAGNVPAVGFHDFLSVLMSGHKVLAKLSSDDAYLIPGIAKLLSEIESAFSSRMIFTQETLKDFDAIIATGSNNTARYFEYYFNKYPHIIRKNRNALAVLSGSETTEELKALGEDIFMYFGLGCRNVSKIMVPQDYNFIKFFESIENYTFIGDHSKHRNNYDYNKSIFLVNSDVHFDNGFLLLKEDTSMASPMSVLHYEYYSDLTQVNKIIEHESENIQCVVSADDSIKGSILPGSAQHPKLWDYADGVDTMSFLLKLSQ